MKLRNILLGEVVPWAITNVLQCQMPVDRGGERDVRGRGGEGRREGVREGGREGSREGKGR